MQLCVHDTTINIATIDQFNAVMCIRQDDIATIDQFPAAAQSNESAPDNENFVNSSFQSRHGVRNPNLNGDQLKNYWCTFLRKHTTMQF
jgi:hypothetical protein